MLNTAQYQHFVMWKATHPKKKQPSTLSAYMSEQNMSPEAVQACMQHETYAEDLNRATRFLITNELPDLLWSLYDKVKTRQQGKDFESLFKLVFDPKVLKSTDSEQTIFTAFDESLTTEQKQQILERLNKQNG